MAQHRIGHQPDHDEGGAHPDEAGDRHRSLLGLPGQPTDDEAADDAAQADGRHQQRVILRKADDRLVEHGLRIEQRARDLGPDRDLGHGADQGVRPQLGLVGQERDALLHVAPQLTDAERAGGAFGARHVHEREERGGDEVRRRVEHERRPDDAGQGRDHEPGEG